MPANEMMIQQLDPGKLNDCIQRLQDVITVVGFYSQNLTAEERQKYGSINEQNKLLVGKIRDFNIQQPNLSSPDVNWPGFQQHWASRNGFEQLESLCKSIIEICSDPRMLHDYSLYQNALVDYDYTKYKANSTPGAGAYTTKQEEIKQFFPNPSGHQPGSATPDTPAA